MLPLIEHDSLEFIYWTAKNRNEVLRCYDQVISVPRAAGRFTVGFRLIDDTGAVCSKIVECDDATHATQVALAMGYVNYVIQNTNFLRADNSVGPTTLLAEALKIVGLPAISNKVSKLSTFDFISRFLIERSVPVFMGNPGKVEIASLESFRKALDEIGVKTLKIYVAPDQQVPFFDVVVNHDFADLQFIFSKADYSGAPVHLVDHYSIGYNEGKLKFFQNT